MKITDKDNFTFIKGIAIICMIIHHAFGFPEWYVDGINYPSLLPYVEYIRNAARLCIPIFVFLTGGGYCLHRDKSFKYSGKKILGFYINYWIVFIVMLILALICGSYLSAKSVVLEALGIENLLMKFCWYVPFYALLMLVLPIYSRILRGKWYIDIVLTGVCYFLIRIADLILAGVSSMNLLNSLLIYFPVLSIGFLLVKYDIFDKMKNIVQKKCTLRGEQVAIGLFLVILAFAVNAIKPFVKGISTGTILVPILMLGFSLICRRKKDLLQKTVIFLGKYSMNIWFLHCAFFSVYTNLILQPIAYFPRIPVLVIVWILLMCLIVAVPITKVQKRVLKIIG